MASPTASRTTMSGAARCALAARNPSPAAASRLWARSFTQNTLCALSASSSWTKARSRSRMKSPTAKVALLNSSARLCVWVHCVCVCVCHWHKYRWTKCPHFLLLYKNEAKLKPVKTSCLVSDVIWSQIDTLVTGRRSCSVSIPPRHPFIDHKQGTAVSDDVSPRFYSIKWVIKTNLIRKTNAWTYDGMTRTP